MLQDLRFVQFSYAACNKENSPLVSEKKKQTGTCEKSLRSLSLSTKYLSYSSSQLMIFSSHVICSSSPKSASLPRFKPSYISQDLQSDFLFEELKKNRFLSVRIPEVPLGFVRRTWRDIREKKNCRATRSYSSVSD